MQNKELLLKQQAFIDFTVRYAEEHGIDEFRSEYRKLNETDSKDSLDVASDSETEF